MWEKQLYESFFKLDHHLVERNPDTTNDCHRTGLSYGLRLSPHMAFSDTLDIINMFYQNIFRKIEPLFS